MKHFLLIAVLLNTATPFVFSQDAEQKKLNTQ